MNIREFKEGDIITRNEPVQYGHNEHKDSSWCGDKMVLVGVDEESKIIVTTHAMFDDGVNISFAREKWDEGWAYYPTSLVEKAKNIKNKLLSK